MPETGDTQDARIERGERIWSERLFEVLVFLFLIIPPMVLSYFVSREPASFTLTAAATIVRDLALLALILFFVWHNGETLHRLGWTWRGVGREIGIGIGLFIPFTIAAGAIERVLRLAGFSSPPLPSSLIPSRPLEYVLAAFLVAAVAVVEETIFRGYLILRFGAVTFSVAAAVLLSTAVFALGHGYEGSAGVATIGFMGIAFALIYLWRGSLTAPMVIHFLQDFAGLVLLPLLGLR